MPLLNKDIPEIKNALIFYGFLTNKTIDNTASIVHDKIFRYSCQSLFIYINANLAKNQVSLLGHEYLHLGEEQALIKIFLIILNMIKSSSLKTLALV